MLVVGNVDEEMSPSETEPCRPEGMQGGRSVNLGHALRLLSVPQMLGGSPSLEVCVAHDGSYVGNSFTRVDVEVFLDLGEIGGEHRHFVVCRMPLLDDFVVPSLDEGDVRVHLHGEVFSSIKPVSWKG